MNDGLGSAVRRKGSWLRTMRAVGWSFFGVRRGADHERDVSQLNPLHVVIAAIIAAAFFVGVLLVVVNWVVGSAAAH